MNNFFKNFAKYALPAALLFPLFGPISGFALLPGGHPVYSSEADSAKNRDNSIVANQNQPIAAEKKVPKGHAHAKGTTKLCHDGKCP
jgi:hypothetical protein